MSKNIDIWGEMPVATHPKYYDGCGIFEEKKFVNDMKTWRIRMEREVDRLRDQARILKNLKKYVSDRDWHRLPSRCPDCGEKNELWFDGTYGCTNGHVMAYSGDDGIFWWMPESKVLKKLDSLKADLIEWSRDHDPPEDHPQVDLWCSMNRLIGDHFGAEWMES